MGVAALDIASIQKSYLLLYLLSRLLDPTILDSGVYIWALGLSRGELRLTFVWWHERFDQTGFRCQPHTWGTPNQTLYFPVRCDVDEMW